MHPALRVVADRQLGIFTGSDARRAGYSEDEIRSLLCRKEWCRLRRGVYVEAEHAARLRADPRMRHLLACAAVLVALSGGASLSHASAAQLHRLPVPPDGTELVRLTDEVQWRHGRGYRVARAHLPERDLLPFLRFRATGPARTLIDCAREWPLTDAVIAMDAALFARLLSRRDLVEALHAARHWVGVGAAARALDLADGRAESPLETRGRLALLAGGLPVPELQVELHDGRGFVARVDGWYDDAAVAIEFDGKVKYTEPHGGRSPAQVLWDEKRREDRVRALDVRFVRIADADLGARWPAVLARLASLLAEPSTGPRRFRVVRRPEPGSADAA
jgi:hypothetical protein